MSEICQCCGQPVAGVPDTTETLRRWCAQNGQTVMPDDSVFEATAAQILARAPGTLRNWRCRGDQLPFFRSGRTGRVRYRLTDLTAALESQRIGE